MKHDHPTHNGYEVGEIVRERCPTCGAAMAFQYDRSNGYWLVCVVDNAMDHGRGLTPEDLEG